METRKLSPTKKTSSELKKIKVNNTFDSKFMMIFIPFLCSIIVILFVPYLLTQYNVFNWGFSEKDGVIGDTIGGTMGPFIAIGAAILTFLAFWVQYKANEQQKKDLKIERFENKFYELLRLHKANLEEMHIGNSLQGRRCFVPMFYELKCCYNTCKSFLDSINIMDKARYEYDKFDLMDFVYTIFFFGIGINSEKHFIHKLTKAEKHLFELVKPFLESIQNKASNHFLSDSKIPYYIFNLPLSGIYDEHTVEFYYVPFDGHLHRLGHYYRHLFQTAKYVITQDHDMIDPKEQYEYIKTLRAQLSDFEQLLLYYNALAWFDTDWRILFTRYRLIKNMPVALATMDQSPLIHFADEIRELKKENINIFD